MLKKIMASDIIETYDIILVINNNNTIEFYIYRYNISFPYRVEYCPTTNKLSTYHTDLYIDLIKEKYNIN